MAGVDHLVCFAVKIQLQPLRPARPRPARQRL
jgi:hypothetical protein